MASGILLKFIVVPLIVIFGKGIRKKEEKKIKILKKYKK